MFIYIQNPRACKLNVLIIGVNFVITHKVAALHRLCLRNRVANLQHFCLRFKPHRIFIANPKYKCITYLITYPLSQKAVLSVHYNLYM